MSGKCTVAWLIVACLGGFQGFGCGKVPTLEEAKQAVTETVQSAPAIISSGKVEISVGVPLQAAGCYAKTVTFSSGRPAILQLTSYREPAGESFPSFFLRAELPAGATSAASGQTLKAQVYVQEKLNGPVWHSTADSPVELTISAADGKTIAGTVARGSLVNTDTGKRTDISGSIEGVVQ